MHIRASCISALVMCFGMSLASQAPTSGLMGYYPFNGNALDESCNNNHGDVTGALLVADRFGRPGSAYQFNGQTDKIAFDFIRGMKPGNSPKTLAFWFKSGATGRNMVFIQIGCPSGDSVNYLGVGVDSDNKWHLKRA